MCTLLDTMTLPYEGKDTMNPGNVFNVMITRAVPSGPTIPEQPFQGVALRGGCDNPHYDSLNGKAISLNSWDKVI
jgi:hypothetical protein